MQNTKEFLLSNEVRKANYHTFKNNISIGRLCKRGLYGKKFPFTQIVHSHEDFNILGIFYNWSGSNQSWQRALTICQNWLPRSVKSWGECPYITRTIQRNKVILKKARRISLRNSRHFARPVPVWSKFLTTNQKHYADLGSDSTSVWNFCARFLWRDFAEKAVVASSTVGCFLRLK